MGFGKKVQHSFKHSPHFKSKKTSRGFNKFGKKVKNSGRAALGSTKRNIGKIGNFAQKNFNKVTAPLENLTKSPMTLMIILGLGAFIVLKITK